MKMHTNRCMKEKKDEHRVFLFYRASRPMFDVAQQTQLFDAICESGPDRILIVAMCCHVVTYANRSEKVR